VPPGKLRIRYRAGMVDTAGALPEALRHGILRLVQHWHFGGEAAREELPNMVKLLWSPWRRVTLGGGL
jgi:hypothetical protein